MAQRRAIRETRYHFTMAQTPPTREQAPIDWETRHANPARRALHMLERISLAVEAPISRILKDPQLNPLYHTGTITVFLLLVILITGVYLTMFYQFGFETSYLAVARIEANAVGRVVRALHRYASGAAVIAGLLHGWRTFFQDRFRGPRWLAWVSGVALVALYWVIGVSGYWLVWDERAQVINQTLINLLNGSAAGARFLTDNLVSAAAGSGWVFMVIVITIHVGLSAVVGLFFWLHVKRLSRAKLLPPRYWVWITLGLLALASILLPVGMLAKIDPARLPGAMNADGFFLFYLPWGLSLSPLALYGGLLAAAIVAAAVPWLLRRKPLPPIVINEERCTGCTLCAADCPYKALHMVERSDGKKHKYVAKLDAKMCVSCGICIGACQPLALTLGDVKAELLWEQVVSRVKQASNSPVEVVFTCERHAAQAGALRPAASETTAGQPSPLIIPLTCIAMAHPQLAVDALEAGAAEVKFIGCPPEDCANREGNLWMQQRLDRERLPRLKSAYASAPITTHWAPPTDFRRALQVSSSQNQATAYNYSLKSAGWKKWAAALALLIFVLALQLAFSTIPYAPYTSEQAMIEISLRHRSGYPLLGQPPVDELPASDPLAASRLTLTVDGDARLDKTYPPGGDRLAPDAVAFEQVWLAPGSYHLTLTLLDPQETVVTDTQITLAAGQILRFDLLDQHIGGDPRAGEQLYYENSLGTNAGCRICHSLQPGVRLVGPSLAGVADRAAQAIPGMSAEDYLRQSLLDPDAYIVEGYPAGQMVKTLSETLTPAQIDDLVAFLLTLREAKP